MIKNPSLILCFVVAFLGLQYAVLRSGGSSDPAQGLSPENSHGPASVAHLDGATRRDVSEELTEGVVNEQQRDSVALLGAPQPPPESSASPESEAAFSDEFERKYAGMSKQQRKAVLQDLVVAFNEARNHAFEVKRKNGEYLAATTSPHGWVVRPAEIPENAIYRSIANPEEALPHPSGLPVVWHQFLEPDVYADIYDLRAERDWLRKQTR